jgi:intracellular septation protein
MSERSEPQGGSKLLIDLGPLLVFFLVNFFAPVPQDQKIYWATGAFMAAMTAAMIYSYARFRTISPLLWFSGVMVVVLGGLTIWLHNETFIKMKPTVYYRIRPGDRTAAASGGARKRLPGPRSPGLDQAHPQLGPVLRLHGGA